jgi:hypothetical protein
MYEKFAGEFPDRITRTATTEWEFDQLEAGKRVRIMCIILRLGFRKFALPSAVDYIRGIKVINLIQINHILFQNKK